MGVVGLGHCGGAMALAFALSGYEALAFNTSDTDLRGLDLPEGRKFHISLKGRDGVGRDRAKGGDILRANAAKLLETAHLYLGRCEHYLLCGGLAGGTGSNLGKLAGVLGDLGKPMTLIGALPRRSDGVVDKYNAILALSEIARAPGHNLALVDNSRIQTRFPQASVMNHFRLANNLIAGSFDYFNRISIDPLLEPVYAFDGEDFRKVIQGRGTILWSTSDDLALFSTDGVTELVDNIIYQRSLWPPGYDLGGAQRAALIVSAPDSTLQGLKGDFWEHWTGTVSQLTKGCGCYYGLFRAPEGLKPRISLLLSGMDFPAAVHNLLESSKVETQLLSRKLEQDLSLPEASAVESYIPFAEEGEAVEESELAQELQRRSELGAEGAVYAGAEMRSMEQPAVQEAKAEDSAAETELAASEVEAIWRGRKRRRGLFIAAGVIILAAVLLAAVKRSLFSFNRQEAAAPVVESPAAVVEEAKPTFPAALIKLYPENNNFYLIFHKKTGRLDLYNSGGNVIRSYNSGGDEFSRAFIPEGIYYVSGRMEGDNLPYKYYPMAYRLSYPGPMDTVNAELGRELYLGGSPEGALPEAAKGGIALEAAEMAELSSFLIPQRTPVIIYHQEARWEMDEIERVRGEISGLIEHWSRSWCGRNWEGYYACFAEDFIPQRGSKAEWSEKQRKKFRYTQEITVKIDKLTILRGEEYIIAEFEQDYRAGNYRDLGLKRLYIIMEEGRWKIKAEEWVESKLQAKS